MAKQGITLSLTGVDDVVAALKKAGLNVEDGLEEICNAGAQVVQASIEQKAPGSIGAGIVRETTEKSKKRVTVSTGPDNERWYARFLEFGTGPHRVRPDVKKALRIGDGAYGGANHPGMAARPFMRPAADESGEGVKKAMSDEVKEAID